MTSSSGSQLVGRNPEVGHEALSSELQMCAKRKKLGRKVNVWKPKVDKQ